MSPRVAGWFAVCAVAAAVLLPAAARADTRRQAAGPCDVVAPAPEDPQLQWDYWWSGACAGGLASGDGFLVEYMKAGGIGDVYASRMSQGRAQGGVRAYGPAFLGTEWNLRDGTPGEADEWPPAWREVARGVSRFSLPVPLQEALNRFAASVGHPQMPAQPVVAAPRCGEVRTFIQSHGGWEDARQAAILEALRSNDAVAGPGASPGQRQLAKTRLALAADVVGCR